MSMNRRGIIMTAAFGTCIPSLVKADSLVGLPGDPLTRRGMFAASKWAEESFRTRPACRLAFAEGPPTGWMEYQHLSRTKADGGRNYAVAVEVCVTDASGKRFVTSVPLDSVMVIDAERTRAERARDLLRDKQERQTTMQERFARMRTKWASTGSADLLGNDLPF